MKEELDPYRVPATSPEPGPDLESRGRGWRIDQGRLMVQDHARLPDVCLYGGPMGEPGRRIYLNLRAKGKRVRVVAFCSVGARKARALRRVLLATLPPFFMGVLAWWICDMNGVSISTSLSISAAAICFSGVAMDRSLQRRDLRIIPSEGSWQELGGVNSAVVARLDRFALEPDDRDSP